MVNSLLKACDVVVVEEWLGVTRLATVIVNRLLFYPEMDEGKLTKLWTAS